MGQPVDAFRGDRLWRALLLALLWGGSVFAVSQVCTALVCGWPAVDALWFGHVMVHRALLTMNFQYLMILPGVPVSILLAVAPTLLLFGDRSPWRACVDSVRFVLRHPAPFALLTLINLALTTLALSVPMGVLILVALSPVSNAGAYVVWRDVQARIAVGT